MNNNIKIVEVPISELIASEYNPRKHSKEQMDQLKESIIKFGMVDPVICNSAPERKNIIIGGHFRAKVAKELGMTTIPVVYVNVPDIGKEKELNIRLNKNTGEWDWDLLEKFDASLLEGIGFSSEELDQVFGIDENPEVFNLEKELQKIGVQDINIKAGDVYRVGPMIKVMCGDSQNSGDIAKLMDGERADMCLTDPPYILDYLNGKKKNGKPVEGFGLKRDRKYLGTDILAPDFTEKWMASIAKIQKPDFSIIIFENPKNLRTIWNELEKHWTYRNTIVWRLPNRVQGFAAKYKFFNKHDIALVGSLGNVELNFAEEDSLFEQEYQNALFATSGKPHWESYEKGKKYCPTDFIDYKAADEKSSGQGIIFGTKPVEILIPYLKVLTKRNDLIVEPFGGSGSTAAAAFMMGRRCYVMEKSPVYTAVILNRLSKLTNLTPEKL